MKTSISSFASLVERDYGSRIAQGFLSRFTETSREVPFQEAMNVLDSVLVCGRLPRPSLGATNTESQDCNLKIKV